MVGVFLGSFFIGLSMFLLGISQLIFIPGLFFLIFFLLSIFRYRSFGIEDYLFWVFIFFSFVSFLFAKHKDVAIGGVLILVLYYFIFFVGKNGNFSFESVYLGIIFAIAVSVIFGVVFYFVRDFSFILNIGNINLVEIHSSKTFSYSSVVRSPSVTPHPVIFSSSVLYLLPLVVSWLFLRFGSNKVLFYIMFVLLVFIEFVVVFTSNSRSLLILAPFVFVLMLVLLKRYEGILIFVFAVVVFFVVFWAFLSNGVLERIKEILLGIDERSFFNRIDSYKISLNLFKDNIFFGVGLVNFKYYVPYYYGNYIHNLYLSILVETGVLGFISFMSLISFLLYYAFTLVRENFDVTKFGCFVSVISFLLHGFIDNTIYVFSLGSIFWFFMGILLRRDKFPKM